MKLSVKNLSWESQSLVYAILVGITKVKTALCSIKHKIVIVDSIKRNTTITDKFYI